jgi:hypothetical protein
MVAAGFNADERRWGRMNADSSVFCAAPSAFICILCFVASSERLSCLIGGTLFCSRCLWVLFVYIRSRFRG